MGRSRRVPALPVVRPRRHPMKENTWRTTAEVALQHQHSPSLELATPPRTSCHDGAMADDDLTSERDFNKHNIAEFRSNGGKVGGQFEGFPLLILTSTGAKSGEQRENLIGYFDIDDKIYVVGSAAGRDASPGWVFNLRAQPSVTVEIGSDPPREPSPTNCPEPNGTASTSSSSSARPASANTRSGPTG